MTDLADESWWASQHREYIACISLLFSLEHSQLATFSAIVLACLKELSPVNISERFINFCLYLLISLVKCSIQLSIAMVFVMTAYGKYDASSIVHA